VYCSTKPKQAILHYEIVQATTLNDSLSAHHVNYKKDFAEWKKVYEQCMHDTLFPDAFYLGLQTNLGIGSISNQIVQNINGQITVLDTSAGGKILDLISVDNSANCFSKINVNKSLQDNFYNELVWSLKNSGQYENFPDLIDTNQIVFKITTLINYAIRPDTLINILHRTRDSSLLYFNQMLTTKGNALLVRAAMIFGFYAEFNLKRKLTSSEGEKFRNEVYFKMGDHNGSGKIKMLSDQDFHVSIDRNYTVFGQFYTFK